MSMELSRILSRFQIKGATAEGGSSQYADYLVKLDADGLISNDVIPEAAIVSVTDVANQAARLALAGTVQLGDIALQADNNVTYMLVTGTGSLNSDWKQIAITETPPAEDVVFTPVDNISSTNVQDALEEVADDAANADNITSGTLDDDRLSANVTLLGNTLGGDLSGATLADVEVVGLDGNPLVTSSLTNGDYVYWNGTQWVNNRLQDPLANTEHVLFTNSDGEFTTLYNKFVFDPDKVQLGVNTGVAEGTVHSVGTQYTPDPPLSLGVTLVEEEQTTPTAYDTYELIYAPDVPVQNAPFIQYGSSGYIANGSTIEYYIYAYFIDDDDASYIYSAPGGVSYQTITDDNSTSPYAVDVTWTAPPSGFHGYMIYRVYQGNYYMRDNGATGNLFDDNSGWTVVFTGHIPLSGVPYQDGIVADGSTRTYRFHMMGNSPVTGAEYKSASPQVIPINLPSSGDNFYIKHKFDISLTPSHFLITDKSSGTFDWGVVCYGIEYYNEYGDSDMPVDGYVTGMRTHCGFPPGNISRYFRLHTLVRFPDALTSTLQTAQSASYASVQSPEPGDGKYYYYTFTLTPPPVYYQLLFGWSLDDVTFANQWRQGNADPATYTFDATSTFSNLGYGNLINAIPLVVGSQYGTTSILVKGSSSSGMRLAFTEYSDGNFLSSIIHRSNSLVLLNHSGASGTIYMSSDTATTPFATFASTGVIINTTQASNSVAFAVRNTAGTNAFRVNSSSNGSVFCGPATSNGTLNIRTTSSGVKGVVIQATTSQSQNLLDITNSANTVLSCFSSDGALILGTTSGLAYSTAPITVRGAFAFDNTSPTVTGNSNTFLYASGTKSVMHRSGGDAGYLQKTLFANSSTTTVESTTIETNLAVSGNGSLNLNAPPTGEMYKATVRGWFVGNNSDTLTIRFKIGSSTVVDSGAITMPDTSSVELGFLYEGYMRIDGSTSVQGWGKLSHMLADGTTREIPIITTSATAVASTTGALALTAQWSNTAGKLGSQLLTIENIN